MNTPPRRPAGTPAGGQFARHAGSAPDAELASTEPAPQTAWFRKVSSADVDALVAAGLTPIAIDDRHDGEPVIVYRCADGAQFAAMISDYGDSCSVDFVPRGTRDLRGSIDTHGFAGLRDLDIGPDELFDHTTSLAFQVRAEEDRVAEAAIRSLHGRIEDGTVEVGGDSLRSFQSGPHWWSELEEGDEVTDNETGMSWLLAKAPTTTPEGTVFHVRNRHGETRDFWSHEIG